MQLELMSGKKLRDWILKLQYLVGLKGSDEQNKPLYTKWLVQAQNEAKARYERREKYLREAKRNGKIKD